MLGLEWRESEYGRDVWVQVTNSDHPFHGRSQGTAEKDVGWGTQYCWAFWNIQVESGLMLVSRKLLHYI